jgi:hypothetical protein
MDAADQLEEGADGGPLTAEEILTFGPVVEAQVWGVSWLQEKRAPIAVMGGKPKLGKVFDENGKGNAVLIRPCMSRGRRVRGFSPIYTQEMLAANAAVFTGWPMYMDHVPAAMAEVVAKNGRTIRDLGGQVLTPRWDPTYVAEDDEVFGYQQGGVLAEVYANPIVQGIVGRNPALLHTSISAYPTGGKPGPVPWAKGKKGMVIEGIRTQPQGSVDFVPRGGAGGRLLLAEGRDPDTGAWPEAGWAEEDQRLVVSVAESFYASGAMTTRPTSSSADTLPDLSKFSGDDLGAWVQENATHLAPYLPDAQPPAAPAAAAPPAATGPAALTEADVQAIVERERSGALSADDVQTLVEEAVAEREEQRTLVAVAHELIEAAEGIPDGWKADLKAHYAFTPEGPSIAVAECEGYTGDDGVERTAEAELRENVAEHLTRARAMIAEVQGKPRVTGEGGGTRANSGDERSRVAEKEEVPYWRQSFAAQGIVESADDALSIHGKTKVEG